MNNSNPNLSDAIASSRNLNLSGWEYGDEQVGSFFLDAINGDEWFNFSSKNYPVPDKLDSRHWLQIEDQGPLPSCIGHGFTSAVEVVAYLQTAGVIQLNRMFCYREAQKKDRLGRGQGATMGSAYKVIREGLPLESVWPYSKNYPRSIPKKCYEDRPYKIKNAVRLRGAEQVTDWILGGQGAVVAGTAWTKGMDADRDLDRFRGGSRGGMHGHHCYMFFDWEKKNGEYWIRLYNSWSKRWGDKGTKLCSPRFLDELSEHHASILYGLTDLEGAEPRTIDFREDSVFK